VGGRPGNGVDGGTGRSDTTVQNKVVKKQMSGTKREGKGREEALSLFNGEGGGIGGGRGKIKSAQGTVISKDKR